MSWFLIFTLILVLALLIELAFLIREHSKDKKEAWMQSIREDYDRNLKLKCIQEEKKVVHIFDDVFVVRDIITGNIGVISTGTDGVHLLTIPLGSCNDHLCIEYLGELY